MITHYIVFSFNFVHRFFWCIVLKLIYWLKKLQTFDSYNLNKDIQMYFLIYHQNCKKIQQLIQSSILLSQIKKLVQFHGFKLHAEPVIVSCPICSIITPGKYKAGSDIFRYVVAYSLNLMNIKNEIFLCGTVRYMYKLNRCLSLSVASICMCVYLYAF